MALTVYWTQFAEDKLENVFHYYCEFVSAKFAHQLIEDIINRSLQLESKPLIGQREYLLADRSKEFRYLIHKNYKIIYWVNVEFNRIEILNLFDCRQNPEKINEI